MISRLGRWSVLALLLVVLFVGTMLGMVLDARMPRQRLKIKEKGK